MDRYLSRRKCISVIGILGAAGIIAWLALGLCLAQEQPKTPYVVFVTGEDEYRSEITLPFIGELLGRALRPRTIVKPAPGQQPPRQAAPAEQPYTVLYAVDPKTGKPDPEHRQNIAGLEALQKADLAVFFIGSRALPDDQLKLILDYVNSGKPIVGLRSSLHAFQYPAKDKNAKHNDSFGKEVFGQSSTTHHGARSTTDVWPAPGMADHPILRGIYATEKSPVHCSSWLYHVTPLPADCQPLMMGRSINSNKAGQQDRYPLVQPVAWTRTYKNARVFFTTLGHPKDFEDDSVRRLVANGILWALGMEVPFGGANVEARTGEWGWHAPDVR